MLGVGLILDWISGGYDCSVPIFQMFTIRPNKLPSGGKKTKFYYAHHYVSRAQEFDLAHVKFDV